MTIVEAKFYAAEIRALLACASEDNARVNLWAVHFSTDLTRAFATNGHVLVMRYGATIDPRAACETFTVERTALESALAIADAADRHESSCSECDAPEPPGSGDEWARRIVLAVEDGVPSLKVDTGALRHTIALGDTKTKAPPVWSVLPAPEEIGRGRGRMVNGIYLEVLGTLSKAVEARCGRHTGAWCIAFAGEAVLPGNKPNGRDFGPMVAVCEAPTGHEYNWIYVAMPLRPTEPAAIAWHERVNGAVPKTNVEVEEEKKDARRRGRKETAQRA